MRVAPLPSRLDPIGFSLENFDAAGKYRSQEGGNGDRSLRFLPDGTLVDGPRGLKSVLLARKDEFVECFRRENCSPTR